MKITQIPMGAHNAQLTCYLQDPCTEMPALDRCPAILIFPGGAYAFCSDREADPVALAFLNAGYNAFVLRYSVSQNGGGGLYQCLCRGAGSHGLPAPERR